MEAATAESNGYVNPEQLFGTPPKRAHIDVTVKLGKFRLQTLTAAEGGEYAAERFSKTGNLSRNGLISSNARIIQRCCVDPAGNLIFTRDDVAKLQELPAGDVAELAQECLEHCGLNEAEEEAKN